MSQHRVIAGRYLNTNTVEYPDLSLVHTVRNLHLLVQGDTVCNLSDGSIVNVHSQLMAGMVDSYDQVFLMNKSNPCVLDLTSQPYYNTMGLITKIYQNPI